MTLSIEGPFRLPGAVIAAALAVSACASQVDIARYRNEGYRAGGVRQAALMPLVLRRAREETASLTLNPGFITEEANSTPLSPGEYVPANVTLEAEVKRLMAPQNILPSAAVVQAMQGFKATDLTSAIREVAARTKSDAVIVVEVNDFIARSGGSTKPISAGRVDINLFNQQGELMWSLSTHIVKRTFGTSKPLPLAEFLKQALADLQPDIQSMLRDP